MKRYFINRIDKISEKLQNNNLDSPSILTVQETNNGYKTTLLTDSAKEILLDFKSLKDVELYIQNYSIHNSIWDVNADRV